MTNASFLIDSPKGSNTIPQLPTHIMSLLAIPNELLLDIAKYLPDSSLSLLSRTSHTLSHLLTPLLLRQASSDDLARCILHNRPMSLLSILRSPTIDIDRTMSVPGEDTPVWPLHYAAQHSTSEIVGILIAHGAPVDEPERDDIPKRVSTLQCAILSGSLATVTLVLDAGANPNRDSDHNRCTPFGLACINRHDAIANLLIDRGVRLGPDALVYAAYAGLIIVLTRLLDFGVPADIGYLSYLAEQPLSALQYLCILCPGGVCDHGMCTLFPEGMCETAEVLLSRGADVNRGNGSERAPLYCAVLATNVPLARVLLRFGADVNGGPEGKSLVDLAQDRGSPEMTDLLVEYGGRRD